MCQLTSSFRASCVEDYRNYLQIKYKHVGAAAAEHINSRSQNEDRAKIISPGSGSCGQRG